MLQVTETATRNALRELSDEYFCEITSPFECVRSLAANRSNLPQRQEKRALPEVAGANPRSRTLLPVLGKSTSEATGHLTKLGGASENDAVRPAHPILQPTCRPFLIHPTKPIQVRQNFDTRCLQTKAPSLNSQ